MVRIVVTLALIGFVIHKAGLLDSQERGEFVETIKSVNPYYLCLSLLVSVIMNWVSSYKWHILLRSKKLSVGLPRLFALYYVGKFFNLFLPTGMGGDVARVYELGKLINTHSQSLASVFLERFTGLITLTMVSLIAVFISMHQYDIPLITSSMLLYVIIVAMIIWLILDTRPLGLISQLARRYFTSLSGMISKIERIHDAINSYKKDPATLWLAFAISLVFYFLAVINVWVSALAFSSNVEFLKILVAVPAIMLIMNLPVSIGGLGLMEAAYTVIFTAFGYSSGLALSTALLIRLKTIIDGIIGGLFYLGGRKSRRPDPEHSP
ncbi:MAG: hypothetical protein DHS20C01_13110 [marine bacterium B5-7]|nr:MAG: hypothetical protein DHS20C01_13110 [marine bacterium B5-7]